MQPFTTKGIIGRSFNLFKANWGILLGSLFIVVLVSVLFSPLTKRMDMVGVLATFASIAVDVVLQVGLLRIALDIVDGKQVHISQLVSEYRIALRYFGATILYMLIMLGGMLLFIVPGVIWAIMFGQYRFFIIDQRLGVMDSFRASARVTKGAKLQLFGFGLLVMLLLFASVVAFGLGLLVTIPMAVVIGPLLYRRLLAAHAESASAARTAEPGTLRPFTPLYSDEQPVAPAVPEAAPSAPKTSTPDEQKTA